MTPISNSDRIRLMKWFLIFSILYMGFAAVLSSWALPPNKDPLLTLVSTALRLLPKVQFVIGGLAALGAIAYFLQKKWAIGDVIKIVTMGVIAGVLFQSAFTLTKACLPWIIPFYADPMFADWDKALHFGVDPYILTHKLAAFIQPDHVSTYYFRIWGPVAGFLPVIVCLLDRDEIRIKRTLVLFVTAWILFGNVFALAGMSGGPVFYDQLYGTQRFQDLEIALGASGLNKAGVGWVQDMLWSMHHSELDFVGPGISAFPSVHVSVATLFALYLAERSRVLGIIGFVYLAIILFLSVYTGFHYALDGYFSIIVMIGIWAALRRQATQNSSALAPESAALPVAAE